MTALHRPPPDLGDAGRAQWRAIAHWLREQQLRLDPHELIVLGEACRSADRLAQLAAALAGLDVGTDAAAVRLMAEERMQRAAQASLLLVRLGLPTGIIESDGRPQPGRTATSRRAQAAAKARWAAPAVRSAP